MSYPGRSYILVRLQTRYWGRLNIPPILRYLFPLLPNVVTYMTGKRIKLCGDDDVRCNKSSLASTKPFSSSSNDVVSWKDKNGCCSFWALVHLWNPFCTSCATPGIKTESYLCLPLQQNFPKENWMAAGKWECIVSGNYDRPEVIIIKTSLIFDAFGYAGHLLHSYYVVRLNCSLHVSSDYNV